MTDDDTPVNCFVCGEPVEPDADKYAYERPVYIPESDQDEYGGEAYHRGCEDEVFEEVYCEVSTDE